MAFFTQAQSIMDSITSNPLFFDQDEDSPSNLDFALQQRIQELERQVAHHKQNSLELQRSILEQTQIKRRYNLSDTTRDKNTQIAHIMNSKMLEQYRADLIAGVGLSTPESIPKSLLRAYIAFRIKERDNSNKK